ncbi:hypothetical protein AALP_AAs42233U000100, partial [Arabis alpina]
PYRFQDYLSSSALLKDEPLGHQVIKSRPKSKLAVENSLVSIFANLGNVDYAQNGQFPFDA